MADAVSNVNPVVARRRKYGKRLMYTDGEIVCIPCSADDDASIVLRSHNGERIAAGVVHCNECGRMIRIDEGRHGKDDRL